MSSAEISYIGPVDDLVPQGEVFSVENYGPLKHPERVAIFGPLPEKTEVSQLGTPLNSDAVGVPHLRLIKPEDSMVQDATDSQQAK